MIRRHGEQRWGVGGVIFLAVLVLYNAGAVLITGALLPTKGNEVGRETVAVVAGLPATTDTAQIGYAAAVVEAETAGVEVVRNGFTVYPDGSVELTVKSVAPAFPLTAIPFARPLVERTHTDRYYPVKND